MSKTQDDPGPAAEDEVIVVADRSDLDIWVAQFVALSDKNAKVLRRRPVTLAILVATLILAPLMFAMNDGDFARTTLPANTFDSVSLDFDASLACEVEHPERCVRVVYAPGGDTAVGAAMTRFKEITGLPDEQVRGFDSYMDAQVFVAENLGAVETTVFFYGRGCEDCLAYEIVANHTAPLSALSRSVSARVSTLRFVKALEQATVGTILEQASNGSTAASDVALDVSYNRFPGFSQQVAQAQNTSTPCTVDIPSDFDTFASNILILCLPYAVAAFMFFQLLLEEKEGKLVLGLRRLGLRDSAYLSSWFLAVALISFFACLLGAGMMKAVGSDITDNIDFSVFWMGTWVYTMALMAEFAFLVSISIYGGEFALFLVLFTLLGMVVTTFALDTTYRAYTFYQASPSAPLLCVQQLSSLDEVYGKSLAGATFVEFLVFFMPWFHFLRFLSAAVSETQLKDLFDGSFDWSAVEAEPSLLEGQTLRSFPSASNDLQLLMWDTVVFLFGAWVLGQLVSSDAGEARSASVFLGPLRKMLLKPERDPLDSDVRGREQQRSLRDRSVRCYKLSKVFKTTTALKELSLEIPAGEVFVLLGHNGAGKSTLINMLTGAYQPTHGKAFIMGLDSGRDADRLQQIVGVCAQHDYLYKDLTAREHLLLNARFKGVRRGAALGAEIDTILEKVGLAAHANKLAKNFSGGMKRRLTVAMSAVGDARVLFLDEPSTGLDPMSKRAVWDFITWLKKDRIVVLTTHNMEEADVLGDTICILHSGQVKAIGDSLFLKNVYGQGIQVQLTVNPAAEHDVVAKLREIVPGVEFVDKEGANFESSGHMTLRLRRRCLPCMPALFAYIQGNRSDAVIREWGLSNTTLEQVFLQLCAQTDAVNKSQLAESDRCVLCGRVTDMVLVKTMGDTPFELPDALCRDCAAAPPQIYVQSARERIAFAAGGAEDKTVEPEVFHHAPPSGAAAPKARAEAVPLLGPSREAADPESGAAAALAPKARGVCAVYRDQVVAITLHNVQLQAKNWKTNACVLCLMVSMLLVFYLLGFLIPVNFGLTVCDQNYITDDDCRVDTLVGDLFENLDPRVLLNPNTTLVETFQSTGCADNVWTRAGAEGRPIVLWSDDAAPFAAAWAAANANRFLSPAGHAIQTCSSELTSSQPRELSFYDRSAAPSLGAQFLDSQEEALLLIGSDQSALFDDLQCDLEVWADPAGMPDEAAALGVFASYFADAAFACRACDPANLTPDVELLHASAEASPLDTYPFASTYFSSFPAAADAGCTALVASVRLLIERYAPAIGAFEGEEQIGPEGEQGSFRGSSGVAIANTAAGANYLNILGNSIGLGGLGGDEPPVRMLPFVRLEQLFFGSEALIRRFISAFLQVFAMIAVHLLFPLAVWRIAYETQLGLSSFIEAIGTSRVAYTVGMFAFDFVLFLAARLLIFFVAVLANINIFQDLPAGPTFALCLCGAFGSAGFAQIWAIPFRGSDRMASLAAGVAVIAAVVVSFIMNGTVYTEIGSFPWALNLFVLLGEARALHSLAVEAAVSDEFNESIGVIVLVGALGLLAGVLAGEGVVSRATQALQAAAGLRGAAPAGEGERRRAEEPPSAAELIGVAEMDAAAAAAAEAPEEYAVVVENLRMVYPATRQQPAFTAVDGLSLALRYGEAYCLLGPNGAGKTTTINVLSGALRPSGGRVFVGGVDVLQNPAALGDIMGFVPQFEVLWPRLTVEEHLDFYCRVKGINAARLRNAEKQRVAVAVSLDGDAYGTPAGQLSGGMRRRLAIGIAIIGDPKVLYMDEMTTGLDPENTRLVWSLIQRLKAPDRLILLTTHSMVEAEALSSAIGIMVRGELRCSASALQLKATYGSGYTLSINADEGTAPEDVDAYVRDRLVPRGAKLHFLGVQKQTRRYRLPEDVSVARVFRTMNGERSTVGVREWAINRASLEEVFISVVNEAESAGYRRR